VFDLPDDSEFLASITAIRNVQVQWPPNLGGLVAVLCDDCPNSAVSHLGHGKCDAVIIATCGINRQTSPEYLLNRDKIKAITAKDNSCTIGELIMPLEQKGN
jgi:hypothetical protein